MVAGCLEKSDQQAPPSRLMDKMDVMDEMDIVDKLLVGRVPLAEGEDL